ncbi:MAG: protein kinase, partial [Thiohalomonadales bacterium]
KTLDRKVALKVMAHNLLVEPEYSERFLREAKIVAQLSHPNIVAVYDVGVHEDRHYLSMEYHSRGDLRKKIYSGISFQETMRITRQMAEALNFAHSEGYIHRDVKPGNILFDRNDNAILTDFGIARSGDAASNMTAVGTIMGTPSYMSPEQAQGLGVDGRADIYSLAAMLFEMLTGRAPYTADNALAICQMHINSPIPELPTELSYFQPLINKAMAKQAVLRFSSGAEFIKELDTLSRLERRRPEKNEVGDELVAQQIRTPGKAQPSQLEQVPTERLHSQASYRIVSGTRQGLDGSAPAPAPAKKKTHYILMLVLLISVSIGLYVIIRAPINETDEQLRLPGNSEINTTVVDELPGIVIAEADIDSTMVAPDAIKTTIVDKQNNAEKNGVSTTSNKTRTKNSTVAVLLTSLQIVAPKNLSLCTSAAPYRDGYVVIGAQSTLRMGDCFSIQVQRHKTVDVIVYSQSEDGTIYRLLPNTCNAMGLKDQRYKEGDTLRLPLDAKKELTVIGLDDNAGTEWIYAVAVQDVPARQAVFNVFSSVSDICEQKNATISVSEFQGQLRKLNDEYKGSIQWLSQRFLHTAR